MYETVDGDFCIVTLLTSSAHDGLFSVARQCCFIVIGDMHFTVRLLSLQAGYAMLTYSADDLRTLRHDRPPLRAVRKAIFSIHLWQSRATRQSADHSDVNNK